MNVIALLTQKRWAPGLLCFALVDAGPGAAEAAPAQTTNQIAAIHRPGENLAFGKTYALSPGPGYPHYRDPDDLKQLTDGIHTQGYFWTQNRTVGWSGVKPAIVTLDLGKVEPICGVSLNTAAGAAGVTWPTAVYVLASDDGQSFYEVCELTELSAHHRLPPREGYGVHRFWTGELCTHGRHAMFVIVSGDYIFADEIEVYRGDAAWQQLAFSGETVTDGKAFAQSRQTREGVTRRLREDAQAIRERAASVLLPGPSSQQVTAMLAAVEAEISTLPRQFDASFRAVLPMNDLHRRIFQAQAAVWRASRATQLRAWESG